MSLLFMDGFDDGLTATKWTVTLGTPATPVAGGRTGNKSGVFSSGSTYLRKSVGAADEHATLLAGFALQFTTPASWADIVRFMSDSYVTVHVTLGVNASGAIEARRGIGGTVLGTSASSLILPNSAWNYVEALVTLHDTTGVVTVRVNGAEVLSVTGIDTKNAGTKTVFDSLGFHSPAGGTYWIDDVYLCNGAGTVNNTLLGDVSVLTHFPSGNGDLSQLLGSDANSTDNYLLVDEAAPSSADYVGSATPAEIDTYTFPDVAAGTIKGVQATAYAAKSDSGAINMRHVMRSAAANQVSPDIALSTSYVPNLWTLNVNPFTSAAWILADYNAAQFGVEVRT